MVLGSIGIGRTAGGTSEYLLVLTDVNDISAEDLSRVNIECESRVEQAFVRSQVKS